MATLRQLTFADLSGGADLQSGNSSSHEDSGSSRGSESPNA